MAAGIRLIKAGPVDGRRDAVVGLVVSLAAPLVVFGGLCAAGVDPWPALAFLLLPSPEVSGARPGPAPSPRPADRPAAPGSRPAVRPARP